MQRSKNWKSGCYYWWQVFKHLHVLVTMSYSSCDNIKATLNGMFPEIILETISMSFSKITYLICEAGGLYFITLNIEDVKKSSSTVTIRYDEITNKQVRLLPETYAAVKMYHLKTYLMGCADAVLFGEKLFSSLEDNEIPLS